MPITQLVKNPKAKAAAKPAAKVEKPPRQIKVAKPEPVAEPAPPVAAPVKVRKPRAPLSDEQKTVLRERLVVAREARAVKRAAVVPA